MNEKFVNILLEKLYNAINVKDGKAELKNYNLDGKQILFLLQKIDRNRYETQIEMLKEAQDE